MTGIARNPRQLPLMALGLDGTEDGPQMEKVIHQVTLPQHSRMV